MTFLHLHLGVQGYLEDEVVHGNGAMVFAISTEKLLYTRIA